MWGSPADRMLFASSGVRPGVRSAIAATWKGPSMIRAKGAEMWSRRNLSGSDRSGDAKKATRASFLVEKWQPMSLGGVGCYNGTFSFP